MVFSEVDRARILTLVDQALTSGALTLGPCGEAFEHAFADRHRGAHAVATSSGTSALEIIFRVLDLQGSDVVVPANTFFATAAAAVHAGARPVFADVDAATLAVSATTVEAALTPATSAVVVVHIGGLISPEMPAIAALCAARGIALVEDAAHAHGSTLDGRPAGSWGRASAFSFYPTKVVASAEGGMILTGDEQLAADARVYRDQGKASFLGGGHVRMGSAWRMSEVHAAIGLVHLDRLDGFVAVRRAVAARYDAGLAGVPGIAPLAAPAGARSNIYKYPALLDAGIDRASFKAELRERYGVSLSGEVYATPLHREPVFARYRTGPLPVAEDVCARHVCLPVHSDMTDWEADQVLDAVRTVLAAHATAASS